MCDDIESLKYLLVQKMKENPQVDNLFDGETRISCIEKPKPGPYWHKAYEDKDLVIYKNEYMDNRLKVFPIKK